MEGYQAADGSRMEQEIKEKGRIVTVPVGISMWPMLKNRRDHIVVVAVNRPLRRYDVPMYRRANGNFVLHRIIKVCENGRYVICGDNLWRKEYHVRDEDIVGMLAGFFKGERYIDCEKNPWYHAYVYLWRFLYPFRVCVLFPKEKLRKIKWKLKKK